MAENWDFPVGLFGLCKVKRRGVIFNVNTFIFSISPLQLTLALTLLITGCTLGPDFKSPESPDTDSYTVDKSSNHLSTTTSKSGAAQSISIGKEIEGQWWTLFNSPALTQLIAQALEKNPNLQAASYALTQAQETAIAAQSSLFPTLDIVTKSTQQKISGAQFGNPNFARRQFKSLTLFSKGRRDYRSRRNHDYAVR